MTIPDATPTPPTAPPRERESEKKGCAWCSAGYAKTPDGVRHAGCCPTCGGGGMLFSPCLAPAAPAASLPPSAGTINSSRTDSSLIDAPPSAETREPHVCAICGKPAYRHSGVERFCPIIATYRASAPPAGSGETEPNDPRSDGTTIGHDPDVLPQGMTFNASELGDAYVAGVTDAKAFFAQFHAGPTDDFVWRCRDAYIKREHLRRIDEASARLAAHPAGTTGEEG